MHLPRRLSLPTLLLPLIAINLLWLITYQFPFSTSLAIGGDKESHRREDDAPFLHGFNASEPHDEDNYRWWTLYPGYSYRWASHDAAIHLPGVGGQRWVVSIRAASGRPDGSPTTSEWHIGDVHAPPLTIAASPRTYHLLGEATAMGDLRITMQTPSYHSPTDPRDLGFVVRGMHLSAISPPQQLIRLPALGQLLWLNVAYLIWYPLVRWFAVRRVWAQWGILISGVVIAGILLCFRLALTPITPLIAVLGGGGWVIALGLQTLLTRSGRLLSLSMSPAIVRPIIGIIVVSMALRVGGMLHPHAIFSDHRLNANNLLDVTYGRIYFTEGLPSEAGGGQAPYPPALYLVAMPFQLLAPTTMDGRVVVVQIVTALVDSLVAGGIWALLRKGGVGQRGALLGAALYLAPAPLLKSFSIGEYANIGGQALAFPAIALLSLRHRLSGLFIIALCVAWVSHTGVTISLTLLLLAVGMVDLVKRRPVVPFIANIAIAGGIVALIYYSAPLFLATVVERMGTASPPPPDDPLGQRFVAILSGIFSPHSKLSPFLMIGGMAGGMIVWQTVRRAQLSRMAIASPLIGWWLGALGSLGILLVAQQGVRWQHFLYPALCIGGGVMLTTLMRRGQSGRAVAGAMLLIPLSYGVTVWVSHLISYLH